MHWPHMFSPRWATHVFAPMATHVTAPMGLAFVIADAFANATHVFAPMGLHMLPP
jgi:hypothetical protein